MAKPVREWMRSLWRRSPAKSALALTGGGVIGGMYEVGALAALEESFPGLNASRFDIYVGSSAGAVVASLLANGVRPTDLYQILDQEVPDPLNFDRASVYDRHAVAHAARRFMKLVWAVGSRHVVTGFQSSLPDLFAMSRGDLPAGFFSLDQLEAYMRRTLEAKELSNDFRTLPRTLLISAVDLDRAQRAVFGAGDLTDIPVSQAIAASSAIPGFFEPYPVNGRDYVDGGVGYTGHADLAIQAGAELVVVVNPLVPLVSPSGEDQKSLRQQGVYSVLEQSSRITSQQLLELGLRELKTRYPKVEIVLLQPPKNQSTLFGPSMSFESSRVALRFGYASTKEWLASEGATFMRRFGVVRVPDPAKSAPGGTASAAAS